MTSKRTIFTDFIEGTKPCEKVYEDEIVFAFMDMNPLTKGHLLVIPKEPIDHIDDCPPEIYQAIFDTVQKLSKLLRQQLSPLRIALIVHGTEVPHAHVHVIPLYTGKELHLANREPNNALRSEIPQVAKLIRKETDL